jgi:hypothetical protein
MSRGWLGFFLVALIASGAPAAEPGNANAIASVLVSAGSDQGVAFTVSPGRQDLYAVTWRQPAGFRLFSDATLRIIGVADPGKPVPGVAIPLGDLAVLSMAIRGTHLFILAMTPSPQIPIPYVGHQTHGGLEVVLVDVSKRQAPVVTGRGPVQGTELEVAGDGSCFATASGIVGAPGELGSYVIDPQGRIAAGDCGTLAPGSHPGAVRWESVEDQLGSDRLVRSAGRWFIRTTEGASTADRRVSVPGSILSSATFLATSEAVAASLFDRQAKTFRVVVLNTSRPAFDPARLRQADAELINESVGLRGASSGSVNPFIAEDLAARLNEAGAQQALARSSEELRRWGLVPVVNNWGYWQSLGNNPAVALPTLQRVVEIAPERAVAWRNLGDAARASLPGDLSDGPAGGAGSTRRAILPRTSSSICLQLGSFGRIAPGVAALRGGVGRAPRRLTRKRRDVGRRATRSRDSALAAAPDLREIRQEWTDTESRPIDSDHLRSPSRCPLRARSDSSSIPLLVFKDTSAAVGSRAGPARSQLLTLPSAAAPCRWHNESPPQAPPLSSA